MGLFNKKTKRSVFDETEDTVDSVDTRSDYNTTLNYLIGLSPEDYEKVFKVANIYRTANTEEAVVLGIVNLPTTFINKPTTGVQDPNKSTVLDSADFLSIDSEPKAKRSSNSKKIAVKNGKK